MDPIKLNCRHSDLSQETQWIYESVSTFYIENMAFPEKQELESGQYETDQCVPINPIHA